MPNSAYNLMQTPGSSMPQQIFEVINKNGGDTHYWMFLNYLFRYLLFLVFGLTILEKENYLNFFNIHFSLTSVNTTRHGLKFHDFSNKIFKPSFIWKYLSMIMIAFGSRC